MNDLLKRLAPLALGLALGGCATLEAPTPAAPAAEAQRATYGGAVSAADPRAEEAGEAILAKGGSATDAAIAVMLALTVVEPQSSGIGGGGFMVRAGEAGITTFDGRETAPASATATRFLGEDGKPLPRDVRVTSGLSVGVPGNIALAAKAHAEHGKLPWRELFAPAIALARDGFVMNRRLHGSLDGAEGRADRNEAARAIYFGADGEPLPVGTRITVPALAETLQRIAEQGPAAFYGGGAEATAFYLPQEILQDGKMPAGDVMSDAAKERLAERLERIADQGTGTFYEGGAEALASYVAQETPQDGKMTAEDIRSYTAKEREAVCAPYRAYRVCGMGPPSSGGVAVAQILAQLERFDLAELGPQSVTFWHLFLESQRLAYADRELYLADSDFVEVPVAGLLDPAYLARRSALIDPAKALEAAEPGTPPGAPQARADGDEPAESGTSHFAVVDGEGNAVSYTSTVEGAFGSGLFFGGFYLNNELTDFSLNPEKDGVPVANRVEGGKRPRSSMAPTIVFDAEGEIVLVIGAAGGPTIPVQVARSIIGVVDFGMTAEEALGLPLIMAFGSTVIIEDDSVLAAMTDALKALGHEQVRSFSPSLKANALRRTPHGWESARDPRIEPKLGYE